MNARLDVRPHVVHYIKIFDTFGDVKICKYSRVIPTVALQYNFSVKKNSRRFIENFYIFKRIVGV